MRRSASSRRERPSPLESRALPPTYVGQRQPRGHRHRPQPQGYRHRHQPREHLRLLQVRVRRQHLFHAPALFFSENFDGVVAPALPAGWVASGPAPLWMTSTTTPDTAPNDAFVDDPAVVTDKLLATPNIAINSASGQVSFRNNYDLESTFDGGVLEVSSPNINAGAFTDITDPAVGGSFVTGGYNATISGAFSSPIAGRMAWSGNSGGYITTVANLGPNVNGQTIKLRFRMGSDNSVAATGWRVDTISIADGPCATPTPGGTPSPTPTATAGGTPSPTPACAPVTQGFDDITTLPGAGWVQTNHSTTIGTTAWFQGNSTVFPAQWGAATSYIGANFNNTTGCQYHQQLAADSAADVAEWRDDDLLDADGGCTGVPGPAAGAHEHQRGEFERWGRQRPMWATSRRCFWTSTRPTH